MCISARDLALEEPVTFYFTTNSVGLFQFFTDLTCSKTVENLSVNAHLTQSEDYRLAMIRSHRHSFFLPSLAFDEDTELQSRGSQSATQTKMGLGRLSFMEVLKQAPKNAEVFFCGAPALQWKIEVACAT